jgi:hypothetical protein
MGTPAEVPEPNMVMVMRGLGMGAPAAGVFWDDWEILAAE